MSGADDMDRADGLGADPVPYVVVSESRLMLYLRRDIDRACRPPSPEETRAAETRRAFYRLGFKTPYHRLPIEDWLCEDPPTWLWPRFDHHRTARDRIRHLK